MHKSLKICGPAHGDYIRTGKQLKEQLNPTNLKSNHPPNQPRGAYALPHLQHKHTYTPPFLARFARSPRNDGTRTSAK